MKRTGLAALLVGAATTIAAAQSTTPAPKEVVTDLNTGEVTVVYDETLTEEFEVNRAIVERVQAEFGEYAAYESTDELPPAINSEIVPGEMLPEGAPVEPVPAALSDLPTLGEGTRWMQTGNHLVEVADDNRIVMVVYDALP